MSALDGLAPMQRDTLGDRIFSELSDMLIAGRLQPAQRLSLRSLAEHMNVSIMPVRDAVGRLASEGALVVSSTRAIQVPTMTVERLTELTEVRLAVEGFAVRRAATHRDNRMLEQISEYSKVFDDVVKADTLDVAAALTANKQLHFAIYDASGLSTLVDMIRSLWRKVGPVLNLDIGATAERFAETEAATRHGELVKALTDRDTDHAELALAGDIRAASIFIQSRLPI